MDDLFNTSYYDYYEPLIYNGTAQYTPETCERLEEMIDFIASTIPSNCSSAGGCTIPINTPLLTLPVATDLIINGNGENSYEFTPHRCAIIRFIDPNSVPSGGGSFTTPIGIPHSTITELVSFDCSTMTVQLKIGTNPISTPATVYFPYYELNSFYPNSCEDFMPWYTPIVETAEINLDSAYLECIEQQTLDLENEADQIYNGMIDSLITEYINNDPCLDNPLAEQFTASYNTVEHHYTLYYYDQAGSLIPGSIRFAKHSLSISKTLAPKTGFDTTPNLDENTLTPRDDSIICPSCNGLQDSSHVDYFNDEGTYQQKKEKDQNQSNGGG